MCPPMRAHPQVRPPKPFERVGKATGFTSPWGGVSEPAGGVGCGAAGAWAGGSVGATSMIFALGDGVASPVAAGAAGASPAFFTVLK